MAAPIQGLVEIQSDPGGVTRIVLDPDTADITAGGNGTSGNLILKDSTGVERLRVGHGVLLKDPDGQQVFEITPLGTLFLGGDGPKGRLILMDGALHQTVQLDGDGSGLRLGTAASPRLRLANGNAWLGGHGVDGDVVLFTSGGDNATPAKATVHIDGGSAAMRLGGNGEAGGVTLQGTDGRNRLRLDAGRANIWLGGNGHDGDLVIFASTGDNATSADASIHLDGASGDIILRNADCAEEFDLAGDADPGTVMVLDGDGRLTTSRTPYDKRVAGVISGAGDYRPGIVLDRQRSAAARAAIALAGKTYCKADAAYGAIEPGDLLTTSPTPGHAMKASDPARAFGAVIGKALRPLPSGTGLVPVLVALQ